MRDMYYGDPKVVNLDAMREDAEEIRSGKRRSGAEEVTIHHHPISTPCTAGSYVHEVFPIKTEEDNNAEG